MAKKSKGPRLLVDAIKKRDDSTKTEIAELCGMTAEQLRHVEAERRRPTLAQAVAFETHLGIPVRTWL